MEKEKKKRGHDSKHTATSVKCGGGNITSVY